MATPIEILNRRNAEVQKIRGFADLTQEAKERRIAEVSENARQAYQEALQAQKQDRAARLEKSKAAVFRVPIPPDATEAEKAQIHASYRAALNDAHYAFIMSDNPVEELERLLTQAERSGDELLARAVYHRAVDGGVQSVVDSYLTARPSENRIWERYTEAHQEVSQASSFDSLLQRSLSDRAFNDTDSSAGGSSFVVAAPPDTESSGGGG